MRQGMIKAESVARVPDLALDSAAFGRVMTKPGNFTKPRSRACPP
jgi:hypothetical protein